MGEAVDLRGILRRKAEEQRGSFDSYNQGAGAAYEDAVRLLDANQFGLVTPSGFIPLDPDDYSNLVLALADSTAFYEEKGLTHRVERTRDLVSRFPLLAEVFSSR